MKLEGKIHLATGILVFLTYLVLNLVFEQTDTVQLLKSEDLKTLAELKEDEKFAFVGVAQDSLQQIESLSKESAVKLQEIPKEHYQIIQDLSLNNLSRAKWAHGLVRLWLIFYLFSSIFILFTKKLNYEISFQKALFHASKLSIFFALFVGGATFITQIIFDQEIAVQALFVQFVNMLKTGIIYGILISIFIYFHPQNLLRLKNKKQQQQKSK